MWAVKPYGYYWLKFSWAGRLFTQLRHPGLKIQAEQSRQYYAQILPKKHCLVFDIGANVGDLSAIFLAMGHTVIACEPDPENNKVLRARFAAEPRLTVLPFALAEQAGKSTLFTSASHGRSLSTLSEKRKVELDGITDDEGRIVFDAGIMVFTTTLNYLIAKFGCPEFIKIDVEGFEMQVLKGLSHPIPLLSFEANLPAFYAETVGCLKMIQSLNPATEFNCSSDDSNLVFPDFQKADFFLDWLSKQSANYLEIFCKKPAHS